MREFKFRAWEKNLKEMIPVNNIDFANRMINNRMIDSGSAWRFFDEIELMQFTGLKDKNGRDIYEGDIIYLKHETGDNEWDESKEVVEFKMGAFSCDIYADPSNQCDCEVIGNIYENPDLI